MSDETFYLLVPAPEKGTPQEIDKYLKQLAKDIVAADSLEFVLMSDNAQPPRDQILFGGVPGAWADGSNAAIMLKIRCPGKGPTLFDHEVYVDPDPGEAVNIQTFIAER